MRKILPALALAASTAIAIPVIAQMPTAAPGAKDASRVKAGTYKVDSAHTQILWRANHLGFNDYFGIFGEVTGSLTLDPKNPSAAKVMIDIPIEKLATNNTELNKHLFGKDFFDTAKFPTARFQSTSVVVDKDGDEARITGNLTIKGVTKQIVLDAEFSGAGAGPMDKKDNVGFHAETKVKRSDFGVNYGIPLVPDEIPLEISVAFERT